MKHKSPEEETIDILVKAWDQPKTFKGQLKLAHIISYTMNREAYLLAYLQERKRHAAQIKN